MIAWTRFYVAVTAPRDEPNIEQPRGFNRLAIPVTFRLVTRSDDGYVSATSMFLFVVEDGKGLELLAFK